ncbi:hypothetical protein [Azospirillum aestuarii]|uniref:hypothetical protein n=1 Tax=Azospirillum aestuarii TaxID=2802052 RepID=UPI004054FE74
MNFAINPFFGGGIVRSSIIALGFSFLLASCGTYSMADIKPAASGSAASIPAKVKTPADIIVTEKDITDRNYRSLGDINVTVNKTTIFDKDPTPALVEERLKEEAAKLGADAVVLARYGTVGISFMSWGSIDGKGRAVVFE